MAPRHPPRLSEPDRLAPVLDRHRRTRHRRDHDALVGCDRDLALDLFEMSGGQRFHTRYLQVGGVVEDILPGFEERTRAFVKTMRTAFRSTSRCWTATRSGCSARRTRIVLREDLLALGVTGPLLRATGHPWDLRVAAPYSGYENFDFNVPVGTVGDNYDRFRVRVEEMLEVTEDHRAGARRFARGPYITTNRKAALLPRHELATSMEALIHHFKLATEGFRVPPGDVRGDRVAPRRARPLCWPTAPPACARAHARPELREPAGAAGDGAWPSARGLHRGVAMLDPILRGGLVEHRSRRPARVAAAARLGRGRTPRRHRPRSRIRPTSKCPTRCGARSSA